MDLAYPWCFDSRRSATMATGGMVATSHPLAARTGVRVLEDGGTAADAAVATAAVLAVVEPHMTGIGGDAFALTHFDGEYAALNASGGAPAAADLDDYRERTDATTGDDELAVPADGGLPVTVPGALDGWARLLERYGEMELADLLEPAIGYARGGVPVTEFIARQWAHAANRLRGFDRAAETFLSGGESPAVGQRVRNPALAESLETVAAEGIDALYGGPLGEAVVEVVQEHGGTLALHDLADHAGEWTEPVSTTYRGVELVEHPPNGQGVVALEAANLLERFDVAADPTDPERLHHAIEAVKLAFADGYAHVADPDRHDVPLDAMRSKDYAAQRADDIGEEAATYAPGAAAWPGASGDGDETVYLTVVDGDGNAVSLINSVFYAFGSGLAVGGFALHNRGQAFSLDPEHANALAPGKRPFHTIIPAMLRAPADGDGEATDSDGAAADGIAAGAEPGAFLASWGVMGGSMQPQGHLQVLANVVDGGLNPQAALDAPRFRWLEGTRVALETNRLPTETVADLRARGHDVVPEDEYFDRGGHWGGGQFIAHQDGVLVGGSDPRRDGQAVGY